MCVVAPFEATSNNETPGYAKDDEVKLEATRDPKSHEAYLYFSG